MALGYGDKSLSARPRRSPLAFWTHAFGAWGDFDGNSNAATADRNLGGFVSGMDARLSGGSWRAGLATGGLVLKCRCGCALLVRLQVRSHPSRRLSRRQLPAPLPCAAAACGRGAISTRRVRWCSPASSSCRRRATTPIRARSSARLAYPIATRGLGVEPFAGLAYVSVDSDNFHEHGGSLASLNARNTDENVGYTTLGLRAARTMRWGAILLTPHLSVAWQHAFDDVTPDAALAFASTGAGFTVYGVPLAEDSCASRHRPRPGARAEDDGRCVLFRPVRRSCHRQCR